MRPPVTSPGLRGSSASLSAASASATSSGRLLPTPYPTASASAGRTPFGNNDDDDDANMKGLFAKGPGASSSHPDAGLLGQKWFLGVVVAVVMMALYLLPGGASAGSEGGLPSKVSARGGVGWWGLRWWGYPGCGDGGVRAG